MMKYFISVSGKLTGKRIFLMNDSLAKHYYDNYSSKFSDVEKCRRFTSGEKTNAPYNSSTYIWGENINTAEVFRRILKGELNKGKIPR